VDINECKLQKTNKRKKKNPNDTKRKTSDVKAFLQTLAKLL
jgi:hypothetical protein